MKIAALAGGVGAARFLRGLAAVNPADDITIIGNTGDDCEVYGLYVSPDLDIVIYSLAGVVGERGWGFAADTTHALDQMAAYGADPWFTLGDRDIGTHLARTAWLAQGQSLSVVTDRIRKGLGVGPRVLPMSENPVRTKLVTTDGVRRDFQEYFVRMGHSEQIAEVKFEGASAAEPAPGVIAALEQAEAIVICPSNPVISIGPILAVPGIRQVLAARRPAVTAITPIVKGSALKGPAVHLLPLLGVSATAAGVAEAYADFCGAFMIDERDRILTSEVEALGMRVLETDTIMSSDDAAARMARMIIDSAGRG